MRIRILHEAELDLLEGYSFYEMQSSGVGGYFLDSLYADIESLLLYASSHEIHFGYHRLLARRFPYAIFYRVKAEMIATALRSVAVAGSSLASREVWAILDCRQDPSKMKNRLQ